MAGGYPCCCKTERGYGSSRFGSSFKPSWEWRNCHICTYPGQNMPSPLVVEIGGISNGVNCGNAGENNGTYLVPFTNATISSCIFTMTLPGNPPGQPPCRATAIRVEFISSGANFTLNVILYFAGREIRWSKYFPGQTTIYDCENMDESVPFLLKSPGLSVNFDNSPCRLVSPAVL